MQPAQKDEQSSSRRLLPNAPKTCVSSGLVHSPSSLIPLSLIWVMQLTTLHHTVCIHAYHDSCTRTSFLSCSCFISLASSISVCQPTSALSLPPYLPFISSGPSWLRSTAPQNYLDANAASHAVWLCYFGPDRWCNGWRRMVYCFRCTRRSPPSQRSFLLTFFLSFSLPLCLSCSISLSRARSIFV